MLKKLMILPAIALCMGIFYSAQEAQAFVGERSISMATPLQGCPNSGTWTYDPDANPKCTIVYDTNQGDVTITGPWSESNCKKQCENQRDAQGRKCTHKCTEVEPEDDDDDELGIEVLDVEMGGFNNL